MITVSAEAVQNAIDEVQNYADIELRTSYSGRGMYGKECFGVVGSQTELAKFELSLALHLAADNSDEYRVDPDDVMENFENILDSRSVDSMGYDTIYYYPGIKVEGSLLEDNDEEVERSIAEHDLMLDSQLEY